MWVYPAHIGVLLRTSYSCNIIRSSNGSHGHKSCQNDRNVDFWPKMLQLAMFEGAGCGEKNFCGSNEY